ncbi:double-strand break repair protein AddB [uncultured Sphingomonas sp.]|uniref:double-strand break repair protein AddB n=1 Tax=uncultured Sphingomonas sp. TaxID=158754 RepID=UPI0025FBB6FB|nr:double-strand break repair protein AddB [uncultured Sphingomonas sp.]
MTDRHDESASILRPNVYAIPIHWPFADALAQGLVARAGTDRLALARGIILLPNNRAVRAVTDAFVRRAGGGLLLPRLVAVGDASLEEQLGAAFDVAAGDPVPPAIDPVARQLILARLIGDAQPGLDPAEAVRLAADLARLLDQMIVDEVPPVRLAEAVPAELAGHWQASLAILQVVLHRWPEELRRRRLIDLADRRNRLLGAVERRWAERPPRGMVVAAGITAAAPPLARLLRRVSRLASGLVVLPDLDRGMPEEEWNALGGSEQGRPIETHPQFALRQLLDRIGVDRAEVRPWRQRGAGGSTADRGRAIHNAMAAAAFTDKWVTLGPHARRLSGIRALTVANPAAEAQAIAVAMREALETPGRTAALVTPDRNLAARVSAHLARWGIEADDSAGRPLSLTPPGTLLTSIADAAAEGFAPVPLLALLKHPLVCSGEGRADWLAGVRALDRALRGPRPAPGLHAIRTFLREGDDRTRKQREAALAWWDRVEPVLAPLERAGSERIPTLAAMLDAVRETATRLAGDAAWSRPAGRAAAELVASLEQHAVEGPMAVGPGSMPGILRDMLGRVAVRPPQGGHPRLFIWGLIEARLQQADLMILGGLNEGVWPALPAPDPWLAPAVRKTLGLPGLERRIGAEAEQFAAALGAPEVLITRARRDARAPAVPSRFWLRLEAMTGGLAPARTLERWAEMIDRPDAPILIDRPAPRPPTADRPRRIAVTKLDRLRADPYAFYADAMLKLRAWDAVDADPSPAWRGSAVHAVFEAWVKEDGCDPARLRPRAERLLAETSAHPVLRALWTPRLLEAIEWIAEEVARGAAAGRRTVAAEVKGTIDVAGLRLEGTVDRIDRLTDGTLAIVDWKTGKPPSRRAVAEGYSMQLGLLGLIAERGGFGKDLHARPTTFEYWSLAAKDGQLGYVTSPVGLSKSGEGIDPEDFTTRAVRVLTEAVDTFLLGDAPFTAKLHPEYAPYGDYDQLMRLDEWYGRAAPGKNA